MSKDKDEHATSDMYRQPSEQLEHWQLLILDFVDGDLAEEEQQQLQHLAANNSDIAQELNDALALQSLLCDLPREKAPDSLKSKLSRIPDQFSITKDQVCNSINNDSDHAKRPLQPDSDLSTFGAALKNFNAWLSPLNLAKFAAIPLFLIVSLQFGPSQTTDQIGLAGSDAAELQHAKEELAIAFAYLGKTSNRTTAEIQTAMFNGIQQPVTRNTIQRLNNQLSLKKETLL